MASKPDLGHFVGEKSHLAAHFSKQIDIAATIFPEREAFAKVDLLCVQPVVYDLI